MPFGTGPCGFPAAGPGGFLAVPFHILPWTLVPLRSLPASGTNPFPVTRYPRLPAIFRLPAFGWSVQGFFLPIAHPAREARNLPGLPHRGPTPSGFGYPSGCCRFSRFRFAAPQGPFPGRSPSSGRALPEYSIRRRLWDSGLQRFPPPGQPPQVTLLDLPSCRLYGFRVFSRPGGPLPHLGIFHPRQASSAPVLVPSWGLVLPRRNQALSGPPPLLGF